MSSPPPPGERLHPGAVRGCKGAHPAVVAAYAPLDACFVPFGCSQEDARALYRRSTGQPPFGAGPIPGCEARSAGLRTGRRVGEGVRAVVRSPSDRLGSRMSPRAAGRLAWSMWALSSTLTALSLLLLVLNSAHPDVDIFDYWVESVLISVSCSTVGALIASRRPENPTGWIFCALGLARRDTPLLRRIRHLRTACRARLAPVRRSSGLDHILDPSSRWRWVAWFTAFVVVVGTISVAFSRSATRGLGPIVNPFGIEGVAGVVTLTELLVFALGIVAGASLFVRLRHATSWVERQQIK